ncbi:MAG: carboxyl-terminal protease [Schlesneria sp.]|nr:carboxyl-terminal protease [Schlesneria sp.]
MDGIGVHLVGSANPGEPVMSVSTLVEWALVVWISTTAVGLCSSPTLLARENTSAKESGPETESDAVSEGNRLRTERRWAESIDLYEKSVKKWPDNDSLKQGLRQSKIHFSIERRYSDRSFLEMLPLSRPEAMVYLDDVLEKVRRYYVDPVTATAFVAHGTESLYFALANEKFLKKNLPTASPDKITTFRRMLRTSYWNKQVNGQDQARRTVIELCDTAQYELGLPATAVVLEFVFGGCNSLDDYSSYLTPGKLGDLYNNIDGEFVGIGIEMKAENGKGLLLVNVLPESPAEEGGALAGDIIVMINNVDSRKMSTEEAASLLQGQAGTRLQLTLMNPSTSEERRATLIRRAVKVKSIPIAKIIDRANGIGYIKMTGFQKNTTEELDAALLKLNKDGMRALIWDVRGNPGGLLTSAVEVLDRFIADGVLVSTQGRTPDQNSTYSAQAAGTWKVPLVLLTDGDSASASEIVAGAIHDHHRGTIVGRKTYGKWSVQSILPGHAESGFRLTTAKFYSPSGQTYGKIGIKPDIEIAAGESTRTGYRGRRSDPLDDDRDVEAGLDVLRKQMAKR